MKRIALIVMIVPALSIYSNVSANAQVARTFVSTAGTDNSSCSATAPCRTFGAALAAVQSGGQIYCLASGPYGPVTISKSVTIACGSVVAGVSSTGGGTAVTIAAGQNDGVTLQGLHIYGAGSGAIGVSYVSGAAVLIDECYFAGFTQAAVSVSGPAITIKNSSLVANLNGININATTNGVGMNVTGTLVSGNSNAALNVAGGSAGAAISFDKDQITGNGAAIIGTGASQISYDSSIVSGNTAFFTLSGGAAAYSYGNNQFSNNGGVLGPNTTGYTSFGPQ